jgi:hypothetical protein
MSRIGEDYYARHGCYPNSAGYKDQGTSRDAARSINPNLNRLQQDVLAAIVDRGAAGATADEIADGMSLSILTVRPRVSELGALDLVYKTTKRRPNASGRMAAVWRAVAWRDGE